MGTLASELGPIAWEQALVPRVYVDANLPAHVVSGVMRRALRWDVLFVLEHDELRRASDRDHFHRARDLGRTLITLDHDFFDNRRFPPALSPGVIVCVSADERALVRMLGYADRTWLRGPRPVAQPLRGRKIVITPDLLDTMP